VFVRLHVYPRQGGTGPLIDFKKGSSIVRHELFNRGKLMIAIYFDTFSGLGQGFEEVVFSEFF